MVVTKRNPKPGIRALGIAFSVASNVRLLRLSGQGCRGEGMVAEPGLIESDVRIHRANSNNTRSKCDLLKLDRCAVHKLRVRVRRRRISSQEPHSPSRVFFLAPWLQTFLTPPIAEVTAATNPQEVGHEDSEV